MGTKIIFTGKDNHIDTQNYSVYAKTFQDELAKQGFYPTKIKMEHNVEEKIIVYTFEAEGSFPKLDLEELALMNPLLCKPSKLDIRSMESKK